MGVTVDLIGAGVLFESMTDTEDTEDDAVIPVSELRELVDRFRERADDRMSLGLIEASDGINKCADELETLIDENN